MSEFIHKLFTSYKARTDGDTRIGELNRIWYDSETNTFRIQLDDTPGGTIIGGGGAGGGDYTLPTASTTVKGGVKIDGTTIRINNQVISGFSGSYTDLSNRPALFSGSYTDLTNKPTIPAAQVNSDWNASSGLAQILNKPALFSGSYTDLTNKPTLFDGAYASLTGKPTLFSGSYNDLTDKPTIPSAYTLPTATDTVLGGVKIGSNITINAGVISVAAPFSGSYTDLTNKPTIPTSFSSLVNGAYTVSLSSAGVLTVPANGIITAPIAQEFQLQAKAADSVLRNEINLDPNNGTYMSVWSEELSTSFSLGAGSWVTGSWQKPGGFGAAYFTGAQALQDFWLTGPGSFVDSVEVSINGGARGRAGYEGNNGGGSGVELSVDRIPVSSPTAITSLVFYYRTKNSFDIDYLDGQMRLYTQSMNINLETNSYINLKSTRANPVRIITNNNTHIWEFDSTGSLTLPREGKIYGVGQGAASNRYGYISWDGNSSGDGSGYNTMRLVPDLQGLEDADQYIIIDPTGGVPGHIHIRAGGTQDNSGADLFLGGENSHVKISAGANPPVTVMANNNSWIFGTDGTTTFPDGYLKIVPNGANPYISNRTDNGLGLVSGSAIQIRQSTADAYGITIDSSTTDTSLGGGALLASGSNIDVNGTKIIIGQYTVNNLDANNGLTSQNKIEINNNDILIGPYASNTTDGNTITAFTGWTFNKYGTLTFPDDTVQTTAWTGSVAYANVTGTPTLFSGSYTDLTNKPTIPAAQVNSDWNASSGLAQILNKPALFSGSYNDLTNKPTIPAAQIQSDWTQSNNASLDFIKNKPTIPDIGPIQEVFSATTEPMGHADKSQSTISFDDSTRTFTISPVSASYNVWVKGVKFVISTTRTVTIPNTSGLYYIYFDAAGALQYQTTFFDWPNQAPTAYVYWNSGTGKAPIVADERHGIVLDWQTHEYLHRTRGAAIANGFGASNYILGGNGSLNTHIQLDIASGTFFDEDLQVDVVSTNTPTANTWEQDLTGPSQIPIFYLSGTTGWVRDNPTTFPLKRGSVRPVYNLNTAGTWSTPDIDNNKFGATFIIATNNINYPVMGVISQTQHANQSDAEAINWSDLDLTGFPIVEFRPLYKVVYQTKTSFSNTPKATIVSLWDLRNFTGTAATPASFVDANALSGTVLAPSVVTSSLTSLGALTNLTFADNTVQSTAWTGSIAYASVTGTPTLATVATSGSYTDLTNKPTIYSSAYIGTTSLDFTRASGTQTLSGVSISGNAGTVTNGVYTTDTGTVTNAMLAGNIANAKLLNSTVTIGSTVVALGTITANLAGLNSVTATNFIGNATTVTNGVYTNSIGAVTDIMLAGSIANNKLTNSSITVNGTSISLGSSATITAAAGTLTGNTLASGVTASSLTSVGTLTNLSVTNTITGSVSGNSGTVTNGVYTTGTYDNPSWITSLAYSKLTGTPTIPSLTGYATETFVTTRGYLTSVGTISYNDLSNKPTLFSGSYSDLTNKPTIYSSAYIGTTSLDFTRSSASQTLNGVSIDGNAATATSATSAGILTTARNINGVSFNGSAAINIPTLTDGTNTLKIVAAPSSLTGAVGDAVGNVAFDSSYIYYCTTAYVSNSYTGTFLNSQSNSNSNQLRISNNWNPTLAYTPAYGWTVTFNPGGGNITRTVSSVSSWSNSYPNGFWDLILTSSWTGTVTLGDSFTITSANPLPTIWKRTPWNAITNTFTFNVAADDSTQRNIQSGNTIKFIGAGGITTASDAEGTITITQGVAAAGTLTGNTLASGVTASSLTSVGTLTNLSVTNTITGSVNGSAARLTTARNINGVSFNGSADITVTAAAGTLTGNTLASGVTASSLTSFGATPAMTSPAITTSLTTPSTSFDLINTTATTVNFAGAATALNMGASTGTTTINNNLSMASGKTIGTTATVTSNHATAFSAGDSAISNVALSVPRDAAIRDRTNGASVIYFDVSNGGTTNGEFQFRSSSAFTNVLTMNTTAFNVNTSAVVTARTPSLARTAFNAAMGTELTVDEMRFRITNSGLAGVFPQVISNASYSKNLAWTVVAARSGSAVTQAGSTGTIVANNAWTTLYSLGGMDSAGDTFTATLQDKASSRIYRITFMRSDNGTDTGYNIIAERLL